MAVAIITQGNHFGSSRDVSGAGLGFAGRSRGTRFGGGFSEVTGIAAGGRVRRDGGGFGTVWRALRVSRDSALERVALGTLFAATDAGSTTKTRNSGIARTDSNGPALVRQTTIAFGSPNVPAFKFS